MTVRLIPVLVYLVMHFSHVTAESRNNLTNAIAAVDANVVFMRHALAPGYGDPDNFSLSDCNTQRNLDAKGRKQASFIGAAIQHSGFRFTRIFSSEWCRCKETTELMKLGYWTTFPGLNSFFQSYADKQDTLEKLRFKLEALTGRCDFDGYTSGDYQCGHWSICSKWRVRCVQYSTQRDEKYFAWTD